MYMIEFIYAALIVASVCGVISIGVGTLITYYLLTYLVAFVVGVLIFAGFKVLEKK